VSVVIPVYNGSNFLREAVDSALAQTYPHFEVIVVNDGSDDDGATENIALSYGDRIRYFKKANGGVASALNLGIRAMSGDYFSWLSHDDVYYPDKLAAQIAFLGGLPGPAVLYSDYDIIDAQSIVRGRATIKHYSPEEFGRALIVDHPIQGCSALVPRDCLERTGLFDETLRTTQDYDLWFRMAQRCDFVHMPSALLQSREHAEQGTVTMTTVHVRECNQFLLDGLRKLVALNRSKYCAKNEQHLIAEALASFLARDFYSAAHGAVVLYLKAVLRGNSWFRPHALKPLLGYLLGNFHRVLRVFTR